MKSLKTIYNTDNYKSIIKFLETVSTTRYSNSSISVKAKGFLNSMRSFEFYFLLTVVIEVFGHIENLNIQLQKSDLCIVESHEMVKEVTNIIEAMRETTFDTIWEKVSENVKELGINEHQLPRKRKVPKHFDSSNSESHVFDSLKDYRKKQFYEIIDHTVMA